MTVEAGGVEERIVYAVFTTPENAIGGNAICAFRLKEPVQLNMEFSVHP